MKIVDIQRFINRFKMISEAVTLPQIRRGILGKDREYPIIDSDKEWYKEHKDKILKTIEKALNAGDKSLQIKLQKFDTEDFFTNDKPRKLKVKDLIKAVRRNFISQVERNRMTEDKTVGIETQYEMMEMKNGVEVYAVYTPMANRYLAHTKLKSEGSIPPQWCIASSTANNYWNSYDLYDAEYPSVFIVAQKTETGYNPIKYELKCDPHKSSSFKEGEIPLKDWVDEWRNPEQDEDENSFEETSLFKRFNVNPKDLEITIKKLLITEKAEKFSKKFGKEMMDTYSEKINSEDEDTKMEYLTKACKNGTFINFRNKINEDDKDYFLDELIRYGTLTEVEVKGLGYYKNKKAILNLIKNKRCTHESLDWAYFYFDENILKRVFHSIPDDILSVEYIDTINVRKKIFDRIKNVKELYDEFLNYQFRKGCVNNTTLDFVKNDEELFNRCVTSMSENKNVDSKTLDYVKQDKDLFLKILKKVIEIGNVEIDILKYYQVKSDNDILKKCLISLVKNKKVNDEVFNNIIWLKLFDLVEPAIEIAIKTDTLNDIFIESFGNVFLDDDKKRPEIINGIDKIVEKLYNDDDLSWITLRHLIVHDYYQNIDKTYELILKSYSDEERFSEDVYNFMETLTKDSKNYKKDFVKIATDLVIKYGTYDENIIFYLDKKQAYEILVDLDKKEKLSIDCFFKFILNKTESELKQILPSILKLNVFDIKEIIYGCEFYTDFLNRFLNVLLESGYHINYDVLDSLLEVDYDNDDILEKIIFDNLKTNREEVLNILSNYEREDLLNQ